MKLSAFGDFISRTFHFSHLDADEKRKRVMAFEIILWTIFAGMFYCILFAIMDNFAAAIFTVIYILASCANMYYYYLTSNYSNFRTFQIIAILLFPVINQFIQGGYTNSGAVIISAFFAPLGGLIFLELKYARWIFYAFIFLLIGVSVYELLVWDKEYIIPRKLSVALFMFVSIAVLTIIYFVLESFVSKLNDFQKELKIEKEKSESLLLNILPQSVANELKENGWAKAKGYASATVVFTDFVKFSRSAQILTPGKLVENLDVYFRAFDRIMEMHGLEKIKTIGDSYLYAGGIPIEIHTHAFDAVLAALDIQKEVEAIKKAGIVSFSYDLRVGIHSGPLVAGVVGEKKFAYDIWGDTVNIAARIEQNGIPNEVLVSSSTLRLIENEFICESRGQINAKNIGEIEIFAVQKLKS